MKKLLMVVLASYAITARAQVHESQNFLYLNSDSVIYAKRIMFRPDFSGFWQLRADSRRISPEKVKFFSNENGFFANTRRVTFGRTAEFAERIAEGKINIFQEIPYDEFLDDRAYRYGGRPEPVVNLRMYYNKGFDNLKKVNYQNLKNDMADNPESMDMLAGYRRSMNTSKILYAAAGASFVAGIVSFLVKGNDMQKLSHTGFGQSSMNSKGPNVTGTLLFWGLAASLGVGGFVVHTSGSRHLESAVDVYNR
ncbi:hypothetical protein [Pedobacter panaciterrae]|uniref:hypothetical protein n=1 Tax=Pedobacter panaciterrae TaxID=363849 RepID=UPI002599D7EB|nr:hypothetical protein [uncultured Pedobacter sp.]